MTDQPLARRLYALANRVQRGRLDDRELTYLAAVLDHYHQTTAAWHDQGDTNA